MKILIIGSNGMLSTALTKFFYAKEDITVDVYGLEAPKSYKCDNFFYTNILKDTFDYEKLVVYDVIIYASGAGVQAALQTDPSLMYTLNVNFPIEITLNLKKYNFSGIYISFGSYMEIGLNNDVNKSFTEDEIIFSSLPVTNDYALSKRLYSRYMKDFIADYTFYHFILPNMFSEDDFKPGTRLIPYVLQYLQDYRAKKNPPAPRFSSGNQTRQFITLEEMIIFLYKAILKKIKSGVYNIGGGEFLSIRDLIKRLFLIYGVPCNENYFGQEIRRDNDIKSLCLNGGKLMKELGKLPSSKIEDVFKV